MSVLPVVTVSRPTVLDGVPNGQIPADKLRQVGPSGFLLACAARAFLALVAAAARAGIPLTYTYGGCYRPYAQQVNLFTARYTTEVLEGRPSKWWNGQRWYLKPGMASAATPGTSNHGLGLAVDTALDRDPSDGVGPDDAVSITPALSWMITNAPLFGFSWELQDEPWHIRYVAGDHTPAAVAAWDGTIVSPQPITLPSEPQPLAWDPANGAYYLWPFNDNKPVLFAGCQPGDAVKYLQGVLKNKAGQVVTVDGIFGRQTDAAVRNLQSFCKLTVDGRVGRNTWAIIDSLATH